MQRCVSVMLAYLQRHLGPSQCSLCVVASSHSSHSARMLSPELVVELEASVPIFMQGGAGCPPWPGDRGAAPAA